MRFFFTGSKQSGTSLIELIVALAITVGVLWGVSTFMVDTNQHGQMLGYLAARDSIYNKSLKIVSNRDLLQNRAQSVSGGFEKCLLDQNSKCSLVNPRNPKNDLVILFSSCTTL